LDGAPVDFTSIIENLRHAKTTWWLEQSHLPTSSFFSGYGCAEWAMLFIDGARARMDPDQKMPLFRPMFQWEVNARARQAAEGCLPSNTCQFSDINQLMSDKDKAALLTLHSTCDAKGGDLAPAKLWNAVKNFEFESSHVCSRHLMRHNGPMYR